MRELRVGDPGLGGVETVDEAQSRLAGESEWRGIAKQVRALVEETAVLGAEVEVAAEVQVCTRAKDAGGEVLVSGVEVVLLLKCLEGKAAESGVGEDGEAPVDLGVDDVGEGESYMLVRTLDSPWGLRPMPCCPSLKKCSETRA